MGTFLLASLLAFAQQGRVDTGQAVFAASEKSVFVVYVVDSAGKDIALGTGFQIGPNLIATNAHVVADGSPQVEIGPVRLDAKVVKIDTTVDLAILSVDARLKSKPLTLSAKKHAVGETVYAIGNPEGLEKTFSQGVIAGFRQEDGRSYIQITTPISHGSSGGPILDQDGEVIGIATSFLAGGQNLNFAIPSATLAGLQLTEQTTAKTRVNSTSLTIDVTTELKKLDALDYTSDVNSDYQRVSKKVDSELQTLLSTAGTSSEAFSVGCLATGYDASLARSAFEKGLTYHETSDLQSGLALAVADITKLEQLLGEDQWKSDSAKTLDVARKVTSHPTELNDAVDYAFAFASEQIGNNADAYLWYQKALSAKKFGCGGDRRGLILRGLVNTSRSLGRASESDRWFNQLAASGSASEYDWSDRGDDLHSRQDWDGAAKAHELSASSGYQSDYCRAAMERYLSINNEIDSLLTDGRNCDKASEAAPENRRDTYNALLPKVHAAMAWALNARGVYSEALTNAKDALSIDPKSSFAYKEESVALQGLGRIAESISAAQQAVRLSDGKYYDMQFQLGSVYFDAENWAFAERAFEQAFSIEPTNFSAAYNIALCLQRQSYFADARRAYTAASKVASSDEERSKALAGLQSLH